MAMVCSCHAVSERRIARAIDRGAWCVDAVIDACSAGRDCGGCHDAIDRMIAERCPQAANETGSSTQVSISIA